MCTRHAVPRWRQPDGTEERLGRWALVRVVCSSERKKKNRGRGKRLLAAKRCMSAPRRLLCLKFENGEDEEGPETQNF